MALWYIRPLSCLIGFSMIYLGGEGKKRQIVGTSSAYRRQEICQKGIFHLFDLKMRKMTVFEKNLRFIEKCFLSSGLIPMIIVTVTNGMMSPKQQISSKPHSFAYYIVSCNIISKCCYLDGPENEIGRSSADLSCLLGFLV